jgi:ATP-dependent exoDNAse (exonuclease V) alpha subunit
VAKARAKLILVGDGKQLQPISAGPALKILSTVVEPTPVDKIVRQQTKWAQDGARAFAKDKAAERLKARLVLVDGATKHMLNSTHSKSPVLQARATVPKQHPS